MDVYTPMPVITESPEPLQAVEASSQEQMFPIREVARRTGVNPVTLRAWERRYGLIRPARTESGHRLYSVTDIEHIRSIQSWMGRGVAVSKVGKLLARASNPLSNVVPGTLVQADYAQWQTRIRAALSNFDDLELGRIYGQVFSTYCLSVVFQEIFLPVWSQSQQQKELFGQTSEWLMLDAFLRSRVQQRLSALRDSQPARVAVAAIEGHCHELELLLAALYLSGGEVGVQVLALGNPFEELLLVCEKIQPQALVLISSRVPDADFARRLERLAMRLDCCLLLGGDASELAQDSLAGSSIGCVGNEGSGMRQRLQHFLGATLDT